MFFFICDTVNGNKSSKTATEQNRNETNDKTGTITGGMNELSVSNTSSTTITSTATAGGPKAQRDLPKNANRRNKQQNQSSQSHKTSEAIATNNVQKESVLVNGTS